MCGEKCNIRVNNRGLLGSPPRVRGKVAIFVVTAKAHRITPACAGKSFTGMLPLSGRLGSPPRVRGKDYAEKVSEVLGRITPACAGKSAMGIVNLTYL